MNELHKDEADDCYEYMMENASSYYYFWMFSSRTMISRLHKDGNYLLLTIYFGYVMNKWYNKANPFKVGE